MEKVRWRAHSQGRRYQPRHLRARHESTSKARPLALTLAALAIVSLLSVVAPQFATAATPSSTTTAIASGGPTSCAIRTGGVAYCWGDDTFGQLGNGTTTSSTTPVLVAGNYTWASISTMYETFGGGNATTCGVTTSGTGYCWGQNGSGELGDGTTTERNVPTLVTGSHTWSSITVGWIDTCGITTSGAAYCWGNNGNGEGGTGSTGTLTSPTLVTGGYTWASLSLGDMGTCGVTTTHVGYCWGSNWSGEIGNGNTTNQSNPTLVSGGYSWTSISSGATTSCGLTTTGIGYCWGDNGHYQYGDGNTTSNSTPTAISGSHTWASLSVGFYTTCGVTTSNAAYCWGYNDAGQVGNGNTTTQTTPTAVSGGLSFNSVEVSNGSYGTNTDEACGLTTSGLAYCWGYNSEAQLGDRTTINRSAPTAVNWVNVNTNALIAPGGQSSCAVRTGGIAYCWGDNKYGQLGNGTTTSSPYPQLVLGGYTWKSISTSDDTWPGDNVATTCGVTTSGAGYCWGGNTYGEVGDSTTNQRTVPTLISGGYTWASITVGWVTVCGVTTTGAGYCWGYNGTGAVGDNTTTQRNAPTAVSGSYVWSQITPGYLNTCGATTTGAGYCWGQNLQGEVGDNTTTERNAPTSVAGGPWATINAGTDDTCGVTTSGAGYCWGANIYGEVGDNTLTQRNAPTAVSGGITWSQISEAYDVSCGVTTSGAGYCWGANTVGEIGDGTTTDRHVPTAVSGGFIFSSIMPGGDNTDDTMCGLTTGGLEYCWGYNNKYQIGDETTTNRNVPTAVIWPSSTTVTSIAPGGETNCDIKAGNAYCWGDNTYGQIGDGTTTARMTPTLVSGGYQWSSISAQVDDADGLATTCGITTSGAAYCWGYNNGGQVGDGTTTERTTPTLVSGGHTWASISVGWHDVCGIITAGAAYCWGLNVYGEDGTNNTTQQTSPALVSGALTWMQISEGWNVTCGVTTGDAGYCWGHAPGGQLGDNDATNDKHVPTAVTGAISWSAINTGSDDTCGITTAGAGYCWGNNGDGQDGNNTTSENNTPVAVNGGYTWASITEGDYDTCGVTTAGAGYCWGHASGGQLGDNDATNDKHVPTLISGSYSWSSIHTGGRDTASDTNCGVTLSGDEYCWGGNDVAEIGDSTTTGRSVPTPVLWTAKATSQISAGGQTACAIRNGAGYCWGDNNVGQVGDGSTTARTAPTPISGGYTWASISTENDSYDTFNSTSCGITTSGSAYCWGKNVDGQVGDGTTTQRLVPTLVGGSHTWKSISVGWNDVCGITTAGAAYCWGQNMFGEDGNGNTTEQNSPVLVSGGYTWASISEGQQTTCGVTTSGVGYCWGYGASGVLGNGGTSNSSTPTAVSGGYIWGSISEGGSDTCGVTISGAGYCWGYNTNGEDGNNAITQNNSPVAINGSYTWWQISVGNRTTCGLTNAGVGYCWGYNTNGEVGDGTTTERHVPTAISGGRLFTSITSSIDWTNTNDDTTCATTTGGAAYCWGYNNFDQVGDGTTTSRSSPTAVVWPGSFVPSAPISSIGPGGETNCAIRNYNAYCWGDNTFGQIGDGTTVSHSVPTLVAGGYQWSSISSERDTYDTTATTCGVTTSGAGYCWGYNNHGAIGDGTTTQRLVPTLVSGSHVWASISVGWNDTCGITTGGAAYCWGWNQKGQDGVNNTTEQNSPALVSGGYTWAQISQGGNVTCGVTTGHVGYCWGAAGGGQLGDNDNATQKWIPTAVNGAYSWSAIVTGWNDTCGVTTTHVGYCWGANAYGQDGTSNTTENDVPALVSGGYSWTSISEGADNTCGLTTTGAGYCWGHNDTGDGGDNTILDRHVPTALYGTLTFSSIMAGGDSANDTNCGIATGGAEYCWGYNNTAQIGDGTTTDRWVPTPVNWNNPAPLPPSSLAQYQSDGTTAVSAGGYAPSNPVFKATVVDPDPSSLDSLCVEVIPSANSFANVSTFCGSQVPTGNTATVYAFGLASGTYKWQAQTLSSNGLTSSWLAYNSGGTAFTVDTAAPTTGTVYDGSSAGVESAFNNGSLSSLSCNWSGFSDSVSGMASYDYSIGTTQGGTDILNWTNVSSATTSITANSLSLHTSQTYYCNVKAHDNAGNISGSVSSLGQMVAPTLTFTTSANGVTFSPLSASDSYTNSQTMTLTTSTNAYSGYVISVYETGALTYGSNSISDYAAPASAPTTWAGTGFGYNVSGGASAAGFSGGKYAHFGTSGSPDTPISHSGPVSGTSISNEQETVTLKIAGTSTTPAGNYATTLKWSCVASY